MDTTVRRHASDDELLQRYRAGDLRAFAVLYARHRLALHSVLSHLGLGDGASGIHHAAWTRLVDDEALVGAHDDVNAALCRTAYRAARAAPRVTPAEAAPAGLHDITLRSRSRAQRLLSALEALPTAQRDAWLLYEGAGLTVDEVARTMDLDVFSRILGARPAGAITARILIPWPQTFIWISLAVTLWFLAWIALNFAPKVKPEQAK